MTYIAVVSVEDGRFVSYRDYWNPLALQQPGLDFAGGGAR
jgi:ketosteroid isomerase-like protein